MTLYPAGPLERAIALTKLAPKPAPGNLGRIAIGCLSAILGAGAMYFYMKANQKQRSRYPR